MRSVCEFFIYFSMKLRNIYSIRTLKIDEFCISSGKNLKIFQTYQQTFQKTEIFTIFYFQKKKLTNVKNE